MTPKVILLVEALLCAVEAVQDQLRMLVDYSLLL
jgi:hypothetical protein